MERKVRAIFYMDSENGRSQLEVTPSRYLKKVIDLLCNFDPVLELEDGTTIRVFHGGSNQDHLLMRIEAESIVHKHDQRRCDLRY